ncbi:hypothetical protein HQ865_17915 [Mucilaginibacter mali]|uniref:Uncharacterized protein n=1 Tax=Mucilaginibacter mali TaxID=2740462 RepID=A0A7D4UED6_9SPHI|nr:hypothetical protein [Mucilaginibacter mali]QKJ31559.1 hypothetical protein HQ865_17915 [Mucilaginibacter mali]
MMKKLFLVRSLFFAMCILGSTTLTYAQDSTKAKIIKPVVKPQTVQPGAVKNQGHPYAGKPYQTKPVNAQPPGTAPATATTPTSAAPANPYAPTPASTDKSLNGQYQYVLTKTYRYQQPMIAALWKNINDTLAAAKKQLKDTQAKLSAQNQSISSLQNDVKSKDQAINETTSRQNDISLLGIYMSKTAYNLLMWGLVAGLGLALMIVILRTAGNVREAKYRTKLYEELNEEFVAYKAKANDKEKKLARELQTERNKNDELMGRG